MSNLPLQHGLPNLPASRLVFFGEAALADGFKLIGFETHADPKPEELEGFLAELMQRRESAFVIVDATRARDSGAMLSRVRAEAGHIVIVEVPPLRDPGRFETDLDRRIQALFSTEFEQRPVT